MAATIESEIWDRALDPDWSRLSPEAARAILQIRFKQADIDRMNGLAALAREGQITDGQRAELESYNRIGHVLAMLHSRVRRSR
jgi:hypothetical protein